MAKRGGGAKPETWQMAGLDRKFSTNNRGIRDMAHVGMTKSALFCSQVHKPPVTVNRLNCMSTVCVTLQQQYFPLCTFSIFGILLL